MIVLDADVLIGYLDRADAHHESARSVLRSLAGEDVAASTITLAESITGPVHRGAGDQAAAILDDIGVDEISLPPGAARRLAELRVATGLKLPDCVVLHAAEVRGARIASFDQRLRRSAAALGVGTLP